MARITTPAWLTLFTLITAGGCQQAEPPAAREPAPVTKPTGEFVDKPASDTGASATIEETTKVHRLATTKRSPFDAFTYLNRIPEKPDEGESAVDLAGRITGRLANQEGRVLLKLPTGMNRESYLGFKTFLRYEGEVSVGNCVACHTPLEFTDAKSHVVAKGMSATVTPSLRNLLQAKVDVRQALLAKLAVSRKKRAGEADDVDAAYAQMNISEQDIPRLVAFIHLLNDVSDGDFRKLVLGAEVLDTSGDIE